MGTRCQPPGLLNFRDALLNLPSDWSTIWGHHTQFHAAMSKLSAESFVYAITAGDAQQSPAALQCLAR
jgi:hypothetical protein